MQSTNSKANTKYIPIPFDIIRFTDTNTINERIYATTNCSIMDKTVHFLPISLKSTPIVAKQGEYKRQNTIYESAEAGEKYTMLVASVKLVDKF